MRVALVLFCSSILSWAAPNVMLPSGGDDTAAIQSALDNGVTALGPGVFTVSLPIVVPRQQKVTGAGIGKTILQMTPTADNETRSGVILLCSGASIENLSVISTNARCNGIVADSDEPATGLVENVSILSCEVRHMATHAYGIWGHKVANLRIERCSVDGGVQSPDNTIPQEGIELYGCYKAIILNCIVSNCGRSGILLFHQWGVCGQDLRIEGCRVNNCSYGILVAINDDEETYVTEVLIRSNIISSSYIGDVAITSGSQGVISCLLEKNLYSTTYLNSRAKHLIMLNHR